MNFNNPDTKLPIKDLTVTIPESEYSCTIGKLRIYGDESTSLGFRMAVKFIWEHMPLFLEWKKNQSKK